MSKSPASKKSAVSKAAAGLAGQWVEVFKAGTHTDSAGKTATFSEADLDQMVVNAKVASAPIVLGHPKHDDPAYGWGDELKREGVSLFAKFKDISPALDEGVKIGAYRERSVSIFKDKDRGWRIRHYGFLGAVPPAIEGMAPLQYAAPESESFEFSAPGYSLVWGLESAAKLMRSLRDRMIEKEGLEAADATLPQWQIDSMNEAATTARQQFNEDKPALFNQQPGENDMQFTQADLDKARTEGETAGRDAAAKDMVPRAEFAAKEQELLTIKKTEQKSRLQGLIDAWKKKGVIVPAEEAGLLEYMVSQEDAGQEFSFSKTEGAAAEKQTPAQFFMDFMAQRKPVVKLGGPAAGNEGDTLDVNDVNAVSKAASDFMAAEAKEGRQVNAASAVQHVIKVGTAAK